MNKLNVKTIKVSKSTGYSFTGSLSTEHDNVKPCLMCSAYFNEKDIYCEDCRGEYLDHVKSILEDVLTNISFRCILNEIFTLALTKGKWDYTRLEKCVAERLQYAGEKGKVFEELVKFKEVLHGFDGPVPKDCFDKFEKIKTKRNKRKQKKTTFEKIKSCTLN